jgi:DNA-binding NtrC family response regulator
MARILVVDDDAVTCRLLSEVLAGDGAEVFWDTDPCKAVDRLEGEGIDLAIVDMRMPEIGGLELLRQLRQRRPNLPVIIMTAFGSVDTAVEAIAAGAVDYVSKPMNVEEIRAAVRRALRRPEEAAVLPVGEKVAGMVGRCAAMVEVYKTIARVAPGNSTVLILGESGTGKELVARAIHQHSARHGKPFVAVDCAAIPENLLESELFGHVRGAFTGAVNDAPGLFAEAHGGTLFLDEIGDIAATLQAKLLRALQEHQVRPVGGAHWRTIDVRVLAATNRDLAAAVSRGQFRQDLYYRLKVVTIHLPALRDRRDDVPLLVDHLVQRAAGVVGKKIAGVSEAALNVLARHHWPGNVRELAHVVERAVALTQHPVLGVDDLPLELRERSPVQVEEADEAAEAGELLDGRPTLAELRRRYIRHVLGESGGNVTRAAAVLGIDRRSLYRMLERYGLSRQGTTDF